MIPAQAVLWGQHSPQPHVLVPCSSLCLLLCSSLSSKYWATLLYHFSQEGLYGFQSHFALQGSQMAMVWPLASMHLLCFSFPSLNPECVYGQCHDLHTAVNT